MGSPEQDHIAKEVARIRQINTSTLGVVISSREGPFRYNQAEHPEIRSAKHDIILDKIRRGQ